MESSENLDLPYIMPSQAQKHVTHNEAIRLLDALVQLCVTDAALTAPPAEPVPGARYLLPAGCEGAWDGHDGRIAAWQDGDWLFVDPRPGFVAWNAAAGELSVFDGTVWVAIRSENSEAPVFGLLGLNATADHAKRLAVGSDAVLFTHDGNDHRLLINKADTGDTASIVFQNGFSGRAEIGLAGDDRLWFKVSEDGETFSTAMVIDEKTGAASFPATPCGMVNLLINGDFAVNQRVFAGGTLPAGNYGHDRWKAGAGGASYTVSGGMVSHESGRLMQVVESPGLAGRAVTVSVEDLDGGDLAVDVQGETGVIGAGAGRRGVSLTVPGGSTGNVTVTLEPADGGVT